MPKAKPLLNTAEPLHIFKPGRHTPMSGQSLSFSEATLQATVAAYNPALHEAPLVVGHPSHDLPAYGWVTALSFSDGNGNGDTDAGLYATAGQVNTDFADMVAAGAFKKISASFYEPDAPQNPVPGVYYLRHVGFLGAQAPAVKGLRNPSFADSEEGVVTFGEWDDVDNANLWRSLRDWVLAKFGQEDADKAIPGYMVKSVEQGAQDELRKAQAENASTVLPATPYFSEPQRQESTVTEEEAAQLRKELQAQTALNARLQADAKALRLQGLHAANVAFCEALQGITPAFREVAVATLDHLTAQETVVEFGEGETKVPLLDSLKALFQALPAAVEFGEHATKDKVGASTVDFSDAQSISDAATAYQAQAKGKGIDVSHTQAVAAVTAKRS
ncbi:peptidase [Rhodoferax aquaticus]|uniref:Peptidase n=1 Tax=Rhodoferax aquaticus TaxID=2527691 RepID=A0A515ERM9_9BURK|nr:peptidase [Rhodoferax aquaticus]QDL55309.1 peptidase [Rhodoferax aquaticus]